MAEPTLLDVTGPDGAIVEPAWLARAEPVHRQLRQFHEDYVVVLTRVFAAGGRMRVAILGDGVIGVAIYRVLVNTHLGRHLYLDDLVTDEGTRSAGVGRALLASLEATARAEGCTALTLDSGTQRRRAHAFYLRERMELTAFHFVKGLG